MLVRALLSLPGLWLLLGGAPGAAAQEWVLATTYDRVDGYLGDRQPEPGRYDNREIYDQASAKFYSVWGLDLEEERALMVEVYSFDFQPAISVQDMQHNVLQRGTFHPPQWVEQSKANLYKTVLEFYTPWAGPAELLVTSHEISQGRFTITWALWKPGAASAPGNGGGNVYQAPCECQDPATGRWFFHPFQSLSVCVVEEAVRWCD